MKKVLFFTHAESGQSNTILALALELQTRQQAEVHIASFPILSRRISGLHQAIKFHPLDGMTMIDTLPLRGMTEEGIKHPPVTKSWDLYDRLLVPALVIWNCKGSSPYVSLLIINRRGLPPEYMRVYESCKAVIEKVHPDLVILDSIFNPGLDACYVLNQKFVLNSPNTPLDITRTLQPWLKGFWYYPACVPLLLC